MNSSLSDVDTFTSWTTAVPGKGSSKHCLKPQITDSDPSPLGREKIEQVSVRRRRAVLSADWALSLLESAAKSCPCRVVIHCKCCPVLSVNQRGRLLVCLERVILLGIAPFLRSEGVERLGGALLGVERNPVY